MKGGREVYQSKNFSRDLRGFKRVERSFLRNASFFWTVPLIDSHRCAKRFAAKLGGGWTSNWTRVFFFLFPLCPPDLVEFNDVLNDILIFYPLIIFIFSFFFSNR